MMWMKLQEKLHKEGRPLADIVNPLKNLNISGDTPKTPETTSKESMQAY